MKTGMVNEFKGRVELFTSHLLVELLHSCVLCHFSFQDAEEIFAKCEQVGRVWNEYAAQASGG